MWLKSALSYWMDMTSATASLMSNVERLIRNLSFSIWAKDNMSFTVKFSFFDEDSSTGMLISITSMSAYSFRTLARGMPGLLRCFFMLLTLSLILAIMESIAFKGFLISWDTMALIYSRNFFSPISLWNLTTVEMSLKMKMWCDFLCRVISFRFIW